MKKENNAGRKCSICQHSQVEEINVLIRDCKSFRYISLQIQGNDKLKDSLCRHAANCLKLEIQALIKENKINQAINHYQEIADQLVFAKDLRQAAREYLSDPATDRLTLIPRAGEISVVYEDLKDTSPQGTPKKKTDNLDTLLERAKDGGIVPIRTIAKHIDIRQFALNAINTVDTVLDKIAKVEGLYQKDKDNEKTIENYRNITEQLIRKFVERDGLTRDEAIAEILKVKPEVKEWIN